MRAKRLAVAAAAMLGASVYAGSPAHADTTVRGTNFSGTGVELSFLGCDGIYERSPETVQPYVTNVAAGAGERSLKFDLAGGNAVGGLSYFDFMGQAGSAEISVSGPGGAAGVAYAGYQEPSDQGTSMVWIGRADVSGDGWASVSAVSELYTWTKYDLTTGLTVGTAPEGTVGAMVAQRGDGPGFYAIGFGCNGEHYYIDNMRFGGTSLDLEGYETWIGIDARVGRDDKPKVSGTLTATRSLSDAELVLERRTESGVWKEVGVFPAEVAAKGVDAAPNTTYRWTFLERPLADGSHSRAVTIEVDGTPSSSPTPTPGETPGSTPESTPDQSEPATEPDAPEASTPQESTAQEPAPEESAPEESAPEESKPQEPGPQLTESPEPSPLEQAPVQVPEQTQQSSPTPAATPELVPCASPTPDAASDAPADATTDASSATATVTEAASEATAATTEESTQDATAADATANC